MQHKCLSIAGFDSSGGAGIQADLKTFSALGCYGMTVLTALPIQNTLGVKKCYKIPLKAIKEQLESIFDDIVPDSIKIGMLFSLPIIELVADFLNKYYLTIPIVLDPVMSSTSGHSLLADNAIDCLKKRLIPLSCIITPNLFEAYQLVEDQDSDDSDILKLANKLLALGSRAVLLKGGHTNNKYSNDLFIDQDNNPFWLRATRVNSKNIHGTGCTLSSAICAYLAKGNSLIDSCKQAKYYISAAILNAKDYQIGKGNGPVNHLSHLWLQ